MKGVLGVTRGSVCVVGGGGGRWGKVCIGSAMQKGVDEDGKGSRIQLLYLLDCVLLYYIKLHTLEIHDTVRLKKKTVYTLLFKDRFPILQYFSRVFRLLFFSIFVFMDFINTFQLVLLFC